MEYQEITNLLNNTQSKTSKFRTRNWVEINGKSRETCKDSDQIKFNTPMIKSNLCDYNDAYILVTGTITITGAGDNDAGKQANERNNGVIFKNFARFADCISEINNTQTDNGKDIYAVIPMDNLIEYGDNYQNTS